MALGNDVQLIHDLPDIGVIAITGGGTGAIDELLRRGGGSNTLIKAIVPYSLDALKEFLGFIPEKAASQEASRAMALQSYLHALRLSPGKNRFGLGVSASLAKHGPERAGRKHHLHIAFHNGFRNSVISYEFEEATGCEPPGKARAKQEERATELIMMFLASNLQINPDLWHEPEARWPKMAGCSSAAMDLEGLYTTRNAMYVPTRLWDCKGVPELIFPGSFNPVHEGHIQASLVAEKMTGKKCCFEMAITNVDKPPMDYIGIEERLTGFHAAENNGFEPFNVVLTNTPRFLEKAHVFPNATFCIGVDTWERILNPKYNNVEEVLSTFLAMGTKFIIFGRYGENGIFKTANDVPRPNHFFCSQTDRITAVPEETYKMDISSSAIRKGKS